MAVRKIETELSLAGEKEFNDGMKAANSNLKTLKSEMALVSSEFDGQANSVDALRAKQRILNDQYDQQNEKVKALEKMLDKARSAYGDNSAQVDKYQQQLNSAKVQLNKFGSELDDTNRYLKEAEESSDGAAKSIDEFGKKVKDAGDDLGGSGGFLNSLSEMNGMLAGGAIVGGLTAVAGAIVNVVNETEEYRKIIGTLQTSSEQAGYTADETAASFSQLYGVLGDTQAAATTIANLQAIGLEQWELTGLIELCVGAWATYGDSIPIDGLAEAINETIQAGQVTGVFADVLNWAGISEDDFNAKLEASSDKAERVTAVLSVLRTEGLDKTAEAWRENNDAIVANNEAQAKLEEAMGKIGETFAPAVAYIKGDLADALMWAADKAEKLWNWLNRDLGVTPAAISSTTTSFAADEEFYGYNNSYLDKIKNGSHAGGLDYVPFDGYIAELHKGEAVLTRNQAAVLRQMNRRPAAGEDMSSLLAGVVNAIQTAVTGAGGNYTINLVTPDGAVMAQWLFNPMVSHARANGTPIINPT